MTQLHSFDECKQLSRFVIAMNVNRNGNKGVINSYILDYYKELTRQPWLAQLVGQIRDLTYQQKQMLEVNEGKAGVGGEAKDSVDACQAKDSEQMKQLSRQIETLKKQLSFFSPHYFHFLDDHRAQKSIDPEAFTFQTTIDIDNPEEVEEAIRKALLLNGESLNQKQEAQRSQLFDEFAKTLWQGKRGTV